MECTDNKSLSKGERKAIQIEKASKASADSKLIKIADKISNCWDVFREPPPSWSTDRAYGYFLWAHAVCQNLRGVNQSLDSQMDELFQKVGVKGVDKEVEAKKLHDYYDLLDTLKGEK